MAVIFNGTTARLNGTPVPGVTGNANRSFAYWVRPRVVNTRMFPSMWGNSTNNQRLGIDAFGTTPGKFAIYWGGASSLSTATLSAGTWYHLAITYDTTGSSLKSYVNGVADVTTAQTITLGTTVFSIGCIDTFLNFDGDMCEAGFWDVTLSATDAATLALGFSPLNVRRQYLCFYARLRTDGDYQDLKSATTMTPTALSTVDHPRIYL